MTDLNKSIKEKQEQIDKLNQDIKRLKEDLQNSDFEVINHKDREYRIYKWEDKPFKDFICPKGFEWCEALDLIELINKDKLKRELGKDYYSKKLFNKGYWELFGACLSWGGGWCASGGDLAGSYDGGRVVVSCIIKSNLRLKEQKQ